MGIRTREIGDLAGKINLILNKYDLEGLLRMGAPEDEYSNEAWLIEEGLSDLDEADLTLENINKVLLGCFRKQFGEGGWGEDLAGYAPSYKNKLFMATLEIWLEIKHG